MSAARRTVRRNSAALPSGCPKSCLTKGKDLPADVESDMNHSRGLIDVEFTIERGANLASE